MAAPLSLQGHQPQPSIGTAFRTTSDKASAPNLLWLLDNTTRQKSSSEGKYYSWDARTLTQVAGGVIADDNMNITGTAGMSRASGGISGSSVSLSANWEF